MCLFQMEYLFRHSPAGKEQWIQSIINGIHIGVNNQTYNVHLRSVIAQSIINGIHIGVNNQTYNVHLRSVIAENYLFLFMPDLYLLPL